MSLHNLQSSRRPPAEHSEKLHSPELSVGERFKREQFAQLHRAEFLVEAAMAELLTFSSRLEELGAHHRAPGAAHHGSQTRPADRAAHVGHRGPRTGEQRAVVADFFQDVRALREAADEQQMRLAEAGPDASPGANSDLAQRVAHLQAEVYEVKDPHRRERMESVLARVLQSIDSRPQIVKQESAEMKTPKTRLGGEKKTGGRDDDGANG